MKTVGDPEEVFVPDESEDAPPVYEPAPAAPPPREDEPVPA
jgi:hypothetical protein